MPCMALCSLKAKLSGAIAFISMYVQKVPWKLFMALKILILLWCYSLKLILRSFDPFQSSQLNVKLECSLERECVSVCRMVD